MWLHWCCIAASICGMRQMAPSQNCVKCHRMTEMTTIHLFYSCHLIPFLPSETVSVLFRYYGAFRHALCLDGMGYTGNSMYFNVGVHTLSYQRSPSHPIPASFTSNSCLSPIPSQYVCECTIR